MRRKRFKIYNSKNIKVFEFLDENFGDYFIRNIGSIFFKKTSFTPIEYYHQLKIQRACSYLQFTDLKIKEIAYKLEYYDPFHFSKAFKKEMDLTPKEYRIKYRQ